MKQENTFGKVSKDTDGFRVQFERVLKHDIDTVWDAITQPDKLAIWFTNIEMDFKVGGKMIIKFQDAEQTQSFGQIVRIEKPTLFEYTWEEELATWQLKKLENNYCLLTLTYSKLADNYAFSVPAGWHIILNQLATVLDGRTQPYPFGTGENEESKIMKTAYATIVAEQFPYLNISL